MAAMLALAPTYARDLRVRLGFPWPSLAILDENGEKRHPSFGGEERNAHPPLSFTTVLIIAEFTFRNPVTVVHRPNVGGGEGSSTSPSPFDVPVAFQPAVDAMMADDDAAAPAGKLLQANHFAAAAAAADFRGRKDYLIVFVLFGKDDQLIFFCKDDELVVFISEDDKLHHELLQPTHHIVAVIDENNSGYNNHLVLSSHHHFGGNHNELWGEDHNYNDHDHVDQLSENYIDCNHDDQSDNDELGNDGYHADRYYNEHFAHRYPKPIQVPSFENMKLWDWYPCFVGSLSFREVTI
ncbi:hypothetical protein DFJ73DRAFT_895105 [Zopfochytrium polystomum]|nr:hypothetical protein DFJ73DRAFT_895105 [Zopfochytrium polystomum]